MVVQETTSLAACHICGDDRLTEETSKMVSLRGEGWVRICKSRACGYAIDAKRANPVWRMDAVSLDRIEAQR